MAGWEARALPTATFGYLPSPAQIKGKTATVGIPRVVHLQALNKDSLWQKTVLGNWLSVITKSRRPTSWHRTWTTRWRSCTSCRSTSSWSASAPFCSQPRRSHLKKKSGLIVTFQEDEPFFAKFPNPLYFWAFWLGLFFLPICAEVQGFEPTLHQ